VGEVAVLIPYRPREAFQPYHDTDRRFGVTVAHRRAGKTVARVNKLIKEAALCDLRAPRFAYLAPFFVQAKDIAWLYLKHYAAGLIQHGGKINESELSITLPHNGAVIRLYGADNAERMRGLYFDGIVIDEAQSIRKTVLTTVILPALADRQGWLDCSGTPKGWSNLLGELVKLAQSDPDNWFLQILRASDTGILPADELRRQRALMSENEYEQEFECSFDAAITGAVYGKQMATADKQGRIGLVPVEPGVPVNTAWDLGFDDATAIWWWQQLHGEVRLVDYFEANHEPISFFGEVIKSKPYAYGMHYVPHDAANKLLAAGGKSIVEQLRNMDIKCQVVGATSQQNGIEAARKVLEQCWFDRTACEMGIDAMRQYQFEFDDDKKVFRSKPRHDWTSHGADAFEIIGQVWRKPQAKSVKPQARFLHQITANEVFWPTHRDAVKESDGY
jgi:phage terminase large subunit